MDPCSEQLLRSIQDPSTDTRDDKDEFYFQRSFGARGFAALTQDDKVVATFAARPQADRREKAVHSALVMSP